MNPGRSREKKGRKGRASGGREEGGNRGVKVGREQLRGTLKEPDGDPWAAKAPSSGSRRFRDLGSQKCGYRGVTRPCQELAQSNGRRNQQQLRVKVWQYSSNYGNGYWQAGNNEGTEYWGERGVRRGGWRAGVGGRRGVWVGQEVTPVSCFFSGAAISEPCLAPRDSRGVTGKRVSLGVVGQEIEKRGVGTCFGMLSGETGMSIGQSRQVSLAGSFLPFREKRKEG
ncbi:hypothetical protein QBC43DRAFT_8952 [Cladorrhinum sp. PSN259]|nr:hypothetical protein QBC43DRAFT_8952 [Cladorrhinum sp. PSN259]